MKTHRKYIFKWWIFQRVMLVFRGGICLPIYGNTKMTSLILIPSNCLNGQKILPKKRLFFLLSTLWDMSFRERSSKFRHNLPSKYLCPKSSPPKCTPEADADTHASWLGIINGHSICHGQMHPHWGWQKCPNLSISLTWIRRKTHGKSLHPDTSQKPSGHERKMPWKNTRGVNLTILILTMLTLRPLWNPPPFVCPQMTPSTWIVWVQPSMYAFFDIQNETYLLWCYIHPCHFLLEHINVRDYFKEKTSVL